ncbi:hypothetical protein EAH89_28130 [Roseomonas nepalensis]|uniref:Uncharacterized protein n=1 Tax=Muricoccus nepalensis TaxID=1854500 RepID=A0A502EWM2_9PROT|nr:hypothetical protein [Roseomonas nepalensis]TPG42335.1 hypothetical protein EAH89_28130 [Roseomonas nepalensis]
MTNSDHQQVQGAFALLTACMSQLAARETSALARSALLSEALDAAETMEALADPTRDGFMPTSFPPTVSPEMHRPWPRRAPSLLAGRASPRHRRSAA